MDKKTQRRAEGREMLPFTSSRLPPGGGYTRALSHCSRTHILSLSHSLAGRAAHYACDPSTAVAEFEAATRLTPGRLEAWEGLAAALAASGDQAGAAGVYDGLVSEGKTERRPASERERETETPAHESGPRSRAFLDLSRPPSPFSPFPRSGPQSPGSGPPGQGAGDPVACRGGLGQGGRRARRVHPPARPARPPADRAPTPGGAVLSGRHAGARGRGRPGRGRGGAGGGGG